MDGPANTFTAVTNATATTGGYGTYVMTAGGTWTYTLDNTKASVQALAASQKVTDTFTVTTADGTPQVVSVIITGTNDAPIVANAIADTTATQNSTFSYTVPANTFTDVDNSSLTYTATGMPAGVTFNATTRIFSGTPTVSGNFNVTVTASDGSLSASDVFAINIGADALVATACAAKLVDSSTGWNGSSGQVAVSLTAGAFANGTLKLYVNSTLVQTTALDASGNYNGQAPGLSRLTVNNGGIVHGEIVLNGVTYVIGGGRQYIYSGSGGGVQQPYSYATPLVLDLNGDGVQTTDTAHGVQFDLSNSGTQQSVSWVDKHDGLLAMDLNGDGQINSGAELFGNSTKLLDGSLASNGWAALAAMDSNGDGNIDAHDAGFDKLRVWVDANSDGVTEAGELKTLSDAGVASINLNHDNRVTYQNGNALQGFSSFTTTSGATHEMVDAWLQMTSTGVTTLKNGESLDLSALSNAALVKSIDMSSDTAANTLKLNLADVLSVPTTNGVHQLTLTGDANDTVDMDTANWTHTGTTVTDTGLGYAMYDAVSDSSARLLIQQHLMIV